ncbi:MAG: 3'-5' exonuclease [Patescibacteria group bacterium]
MHEIEFVALDCETTGLDFENDSIIELGAVKFSLVENSDSFDSLFCSPTRIPQFVERLTGIRNSDLAGAPQFGEKREEIQKFCEGAILIGHNLGFDLAFLAAAGVDFRKFPSFDTFRIAGLLLPRGESLSLENLTTKFNIRHEDAHRALADAEATRDLLRVFVSLAQNFSRENWQKIAELKSSEKNWTQNFASLVLESEVKLRSEVKGQRLEVAKSSDEKEVVEIRDEVVEGLRSKFEKRKTPLLLETSATAEEILAAAEKSEQPAVIFFGSNFTARRLSAEKSFAARTQIDSEKLKNFLAKNLSAVELPLAAKLTLYPEKNFHELNLTRTEGLLFDFVAAERMPETSKEKVIVSDHAALPDFESAKRLKIIADAVTLPENLARANSFVIDLPTLEELLPQYSEKIQIWWGLLGLLFREASPRFGRLDLADARGFSNFSKAIEAGKNFLEIARENLPPRVAFFLENFLAENSGFHRSLRSNAANEITLVVEPTEVSLPDFSNSILLDAAADADDGFAFARRILALPENSSAEKLQIAGELPRFLVADDFPDPATPQFFPAVEKFLLKSLSELEGVTAIVFPNRMEAGNFARRAIAECDFPVFFRRIPSAEKLASLEKAAVIFTIGSPFFPACQNFILVKLPFIVRDGADWNRETLPATVLRFKKMWVNFASSKTFIALDPRLLGKGYGRNFLAAIPQKFESFSASGK